MYGREVMTPFYNFLLIHTIATIPLPSSHHDIHQSHLAHYEWSTSKQLMAGSGLSNHGSPTLYTMTLGNWNGSTCNTAGDMSDHPAPL